MNYFAINNNKWWQWLVYVNLPTCGSLCNVNCDNPLAITITNTIKHKLISLSPFFHLLPRNSECSLRRAESHYRLQHIHTYQASQRIVQGKLETVQSSSHLFFLLQPVCLSSTVLITHFPMIIMATDELQIQNSQQFSYLANFTRLFKFNYFKLWNALQP